MQIKNINWIDTIKTVAPALATVLGGPLAGTAVKILGETLLGNKDATPEKIEEIIKAGLSGDDLINLKKADQDFQVKMKSLDLDFEKIDLNDRTSARDREKSLGRWSSIGINTIGMLILVGFFAVVYRILNDNIVGDPNKLMLIGALVGYTSAKADQVVAYFFGSSIGSKQKTDKLADALNQSLGGGKIDK